MRLRPCLARLALCICTLATPAAAALYEGRVVAVTDGHTLVALIGGKRVAVRLAGISAPTGSERYAIGARQALIAVCGGEPAQIDTGVDGRSGDAHTIRPDGDGVLVARVACNGADAAAEQVRRGMATVRSAEAADPLLHALQAEARAARRGIWSIVRASPRPQ